MSVGAAALLSLAVPLGVARAADAPAPCATDAVWCADMNPGTRCSPDLVGWSGVADYFNGDTLSTNTFEYEDGTYYLGEISVDSDANLKVAFADSGTDALRDAAVRARLELLVDDGEDTLEFPLGSAAYVHDTGEYVLRWASTGIVWASPDGVRLQIKEIPKGAFRPVFSSESDDLIDTTFVLMIDFGFRRAVDALPAGALRVVNGTVETPRKTWGPNGEAPDGRFWEATVWPPNLRGGPIEFGRGVTRPLTVDIAADAVVDAGSHPDVVQNLAAETYTRAIYDGDLCNGEATGCTEPPNRDRLCIVHDGSGCFQPSQGPFAGPLDIELWFVRDHVFFAQVEGVDLEDVWVPNGTKADLRSKHGDSSDFLLTVTPDPAYTGPFTIRVPDGAAHACESEDLADCDLARPTRGDSLVLSVVGDG